MKIIKNCDNAENHKKTFKQQQKEVMHLFQLMEENLILTNTYTNSGSIEIDPLTKEKTFAYYFLSKMKNQINDYFENKVEIIGVE